MTLIYSQFRLEGDPLTPWQEDHAKIILEQVNDLRELRFKFCPSLLKEQKFWKIYFLLVRNKLTEYSKEMNDRNYKPPSLNVPEPSTPRKASSSLRTPPVSPIFEFGSNSAASTKSGSEIEDYFDQMMRDSINNSSILEESIDPEYDNYFIEVDNEQSLNSSTLSTPTKLRTASLRLDITNSPLSPTSTNGISPKAKANGNASQHDK